ncbi:hypothetical protein EYF80_051360 [Liparis tanakae]|uniref:Uncharacterized protein n=1 Tax=Liparis tanakae TaxID=230148 RepID=A0A4Z2FDN1_9TELE|nr:hypothetical protein EYF80_051360 [Liparis tanakae]
MSRALGSSGDEMDLRWSCSLQSCVQRTPSRLGQALMSLRSTSSALPCLSLMGSKYTCPSPRGAPYLQVGDGLQHLEACLQRAGAGGLGGGEALLQPGDLLPQRKSCMRELEQQSSTSTMGIWSSGDQQIYLFKLLTNLLVGWKRWRRLLDTECFLPGAGALHCSVRRGGGERRRSLTLEQKKKPAGSSQTPILMRNLIGLQAQTT